jgi:protein-S-isoprenylcysteine O-methyltransferase Ste14
MEAKLLLLPWFMGVLYSSIPLFWFAIHPFAGRWRKFQRSPYQVLLPLWAAIILALAWISWPWRGVKIYHPLSRWQMIAGAAALGCFWLGFRVYRKTFAEFGAHKLSGEAELRPEEHAQALVTTGLHARMRHPIYIGHLSMLAGWTLVSGLVVNFVLLAVCALVTFPLMIWLEERELEKRFGDRFGEYKARVPLFPIPCARGTRA